MSSRGGSNKPKSKLCVYQTLPESLLGDGRTRVLPLYLAVQHVDSVLHTHIIARRNPDSFIGNLHLPGRQRPHRVNTVLLRETTIRINNTMDFFS